MSPSALVEKKIDALKKYIAKLNEIFFTGRIKMNLNVTLSAVEVLSIDYETHKRFLFSKELI